MSRYVCALFIMLYVIHDGSTKPFLFSNSNPFFGNSESSSVPESKESEIIERIPPKHSEKQIQTENTNDLTDDEPPTLVQRKIQKIVQKFVTLSQIHAAVQGNLDDTQNENNFKYENLEDFGDSTTDDFIGDGEPYIPMVSGFARSYPTSDSDKPLRIQLTTEESTEMNPGEEKNSFGYFILESLASLVGLTVGAFTHIQYILTHNSTQT